MDSNPAETPKSPAPGASAVGVGELLRGDFREVSDSAVPELTAFPALVWIVAGAGLFGAALGSWRSGSQAMITATKFPILILLTTFGNAALNFMLAAQFGFRLRWSECLHYFLLAFVIASVCLAAFSPLILFLVWNLPAPTPRMTTTPPGYFWLQLIAVILLAAAGIVGHRRLLQKMSRVISPSVARRVFWSWLAINLFLGSQLAWILRPFVGLPSLPVEFFRPHAFSGSFYETLFLAVTDLLKN
jgi:hypothetical protein